MCTVNGQRKAEEETFQPELSSAAPRVELPSLTINNPALVIWCDEGPKVCEMMKMKTRCNKKKKEQMTVLNDT